MTVLRTTLAALAAFTLVPAIAQGQAIEEKNLVSGKVSLDPAKGYIFIQSAMRSQGLFLRVPDDETRTEYQKDWDEAFAKAQKKYASAIKNWEIDAKVARETKAKMPVKPEEPTRETFTIGPIELRDQVAYGPMFVFAKSETQFSYLTAVKPGSYIYYGPIYYAPGLAPAGLCYCMGSVRFDVKAGVITDLGNSLVALPKAAEPFDVQTQLMMKMDKERRAKGKASLIPAMDPAYGVPASLNSLPAVQAELRASGKINNFYGIPVSRIAPIAGVLGYRRDTVVDLRTGTDLPNPTIRTQVRIKK